MQKWKYFLEWDYERQENLAAFSYFENGDLAWKMNNVLGEKEGRESEALLDEYYGKIRRARRIFESHSSSHFKRLKRRWKRNLHVRTAAWTLQREVQP